ncbi:MAG: hypothetical protein GSR86_00420, partial [Desulfurococcales archaeon]|nr:hypothetical protein [Desulfurococcales archaeon]
MGVVVHGCRVYYNELLEPLGIPLVGECTVSGSVTDRGEHVAREAWSLLRELVGVAGEARYTGSEVIGKRFTVNRYTLTINGGSEGELRVVTRGDLLLNVSMVLS